MKFYQTDLSIVKHNCRQFYAYAQRLGIRVDPVKGDGILEVSEKAGVNCHDAICILRWIDSKMPFYRVYPAFIEQLEIIGADLIKSDSMLRLYEESFLSGEAISIEMPHDKKSLFSETLVSTALVDTGDYPTLGLSLRTSDIRMGNTGGFAVGLPVETIAEMPDDDKDWMKITRQAGLIFLSILAIGDNPDLIQPIPLAKDRNRYEKTLDPKYINKARRRGVHGFEVGKVLEDEKNVLDRIRRDGSIVSPHYRRSHLALQRYGKGLSQSKIILRKGSFVNLSKIKDVPMGYYQ